LLGYFVRTVVATRPVRGYKGRPPREDVEVHFAIDVRRREEAIEQRKRPMGWQVYGTNGVTLALPAVVWAYRGQYRVEDDWSRLKGRSLGLTPLYLQDEGRIGGLVYLLSLAPRVLSLLEWATRARLRQEGEKLQGIYAGQPGRKTDRPSAELLLEAMKAISVGVVELNGRVHALLSPLTPLHKRLLELWNMPPDLYDKVARGFPKTPENTSEP
jgi:transposase